MKTQSPTNSLTESIIKYLTFKGAFALRINTSGIPIMKGKTVISWRKSKSKGSADIRAIYKGLSIDIEIKKGNDKLNPDQEYFKERVLQSGGQYWEIRTFEEFEDYFKNFITYLK